MVTARVGVWMGALLLLAACGYRGPVSRLETPDPALGPEQLKEARAREARRVEAGLIVPAEARPVRVDELTVKLDVRLDDPFSLPPDGTAGAGPVPFPSDVPSPRPRFRERAVDPVAADAAAAAAGGDAAAAAAAAGGAATRQAETPGPR